MALLCRGLRRVGLSGASRPSTSRRSAAAVGAPRMRLLGVTSRQSSDWVKAFLNGEIESRANAVPDDRLGVPDDAAPAPGTPLRPRSSIRPPFAPQRWQTPSELEPRDSKERYEQLFAGVGVEKVDTHVWHRVDEDGNTTQRHFYNAFPKSRKLVTEYDIVIVGSGAGGMAVAHKLQGAGMEGVTRQLDHEGNLHLPENEQRFRYKTLIIEPSADHHYQPMWTLVGGGKRKLAEASAPNVDFIAAMRGTGTTHSLPTSVTEFLPLENALLTADGRKIKYKQLVVAAGIEVKVNKIKGLSDALGRAGVSSNYVWPYPTRTWDMVRFFPGGNALFTVPAGTIKCAGAPQKIMYLAEDYWRQHVGRDRCNIKFMSGLGKLFGVPHYEQKLLSKCAEKGITDLNFGLNLVEVNGPEKLAVFERVLPSAAGSVGDRVTVPFDFLHVTPPQGPYDFIASSQLADANGWLDVNKETLQHNRFPNVFAIGDCASLPTSKTAAAAGAQSAILAENLVRYREGRPLTARYDGYTACPFTLGNDEAMFAEFDYSLTPKETFPGASPKFLYQLKEEVLPALYWTRLITGQHNMAQYRALAAKASSIIGSP